MIQTPLKNEIVLPVYSRVFKPACTEKVSLGSLLAYSLISDYHTSAHELPVYKTNPTPQQTIFQNDPLVLQL